MYLYELEAWICECNTYASVCEHMIWHLCFSFNCILILNWIVRMNVTTLLLLWFIYWHSIVQCAPARGAPAPRPRTPGSARLGPSEQARNRRLGPTHPAPKKSEVKRSLNEGGKAREGPKSRMHRRTTEFKWMNVNPSSAATAAHCSVRASQCSIPRTNRCWWNYERWIMID